MPLVSIQLNVKDIYYCLSSAAKVNKIFSVILQLNVRCENGVPLNSEQLERIHTADKNKHHASQESSLEASISKEILPSSENKLDTGQTSQNNSLFAVCINDEHLSAKDQSAIKPDHMTLKMATPSESTNTKFWTVEKEQILVDMWS
ncbi:hypothetical protein LOTGIDRAFT_164876 [Lottia gigantea]|uniref:Uncharacterized protein n=1 Tax=Lottia gigantea TaxID=225164 RepID=V4A8G4_LOTGI|nr:hypothetical protein LOTGIDRAFT_164876 [Lottia gigantea]ESO89581.1 hypothetical protein LOTGIDRAFT_164876 [Lottia gigantea]